MQFSPVGFLEMTFPWGPEGHCSVSTSMQRPSGFGGAGTTQELKEAQYLADRNIFGSFLFIDFREEGSGRER